MNCKICTQQTKEIFTAKILNKYNIKYYHCQYCNFLHTEEPFWLEEAYNESINISDTGYIQRNLLLSQKVTIILSLFCNKNGKFLDYGGGYGMFVRLMRDIGYDFYWYDRYTQNLFAKGFEYEKDIKYDAITTFETFEHFVNPLEEIERMLTITKTIIFSTELLQNPIPNPENWWYYGLDHGQHISFYNEKTLKFIANKYHLNYQNLGTVHILTDKKLPKCTKYLLKLTRFGLHNFLGKKMKSKTWEDHIKMSNKK